MCGELRPFGMTYISLFNIIQMSIRSCDMVSSTFAKRFCTNIKRYETRGSIV